MQHVQGPGFARIVSEKSIANVWGGRPVTSAFNISQAEQSEGAALDFRNSGGTDRAASQLWQVFIS